MESYHDIPNSSGFIIYIALGAVLAYCILNISYLRKKFRRSQLPPGPQRIPILGNLYQMGTDPHLIMYQWAKKYGKLCTVYFGPKPALLVSDPFWMKELFGTHAFTGKFKTDSILLMSQGEYGIMNTVGDAWVEQRLFCMKSLKELGFENGRRMEPLILREVLEVCEWIRESVRENKDMSIVLKDTLKQATINALWTLVSGDRLVLGESEAARLMQNFEDKLQITIKSGLCFFPWLKYLAPKMSGYVGFDEACKDIHKFIGEKFKSRMEIHVEGERNDLIDMYIECINGAQRGEGGSTFHGKEGIKQCIASVVELFVAGVETTTTTLKWALVYLAGNQEVQKKLQKEIDDVIGRHNEPALTDKSRLPYMEAVILETLRISSIAPFGVIHQLMEEVIFKEYSLPKGLLLVPNMYFVHHDPNIWGDPEVFRPERFLSGNDSLKDFLVPFQTGRRQCLGEPLARDILFLFITKLLQEFNVTLDSNIDFEEYLKPDVGAILLPKPYGLFMSSR